MNLIYHKLYVEVLTGDTLPFFAGSMLRGAFGPALKQTVCINPSYKCQDCFAANSCLFYQFYEKANHQHDYRFEVELKPRIFAFSLLLFNNAATKLPYILSALHHMLTHVGLGPNKKCYESFTIFCNDILIYNGGSYDMGQIQLQEFTYVPLEEEFVLRFVTPLRIKSQNEFLKTAPTLTQLLFSIKNRYEELSGGSRTKLGYEPSYHQRFARTSFLDLARYSSRQESKLGIGGIMGEIGYSGVDEESRRILRLGELIGVGKQTVFGLGKIKIEEHK
ncbi:MAG: CRISPR system precrRNA processing endoribonuclease RAMP protein Cas6 [Sulfurimonas sp.]|uniref:CRISPR system precrRNA processing endoribonuclease RAMP protein Cas6 n=1 Tax=Sulfurimonas sp. TaxID=2022749 RepID=UPI003D135D59